MSITLDDIAKAIEIRYAPFEIDLGDGFTAELVSPLRLGEKKRRALVAAQNDLQRVQSDDGVDVDVQMKQLRTMIRLVAKHDHQATRLLEVAAAQGDDGSDELAFLAYVFERYNEQTQLGGTLAVVELIELAGGDAIAYDLSHIHGVDLFGVIEDLRSDTPVWSPRRLFALLTWLPDTSATAAVLRGGRGFYGWGLDRYLAVADLDATRGLDYVVRSAVSTKRPKAPTPTPVPQHTAPTTPTAAQPTRRLPAGITSA